MIHIQCGGKEPPIWRPSPSFCLQKRTEQWATLTKERSSSAQSWILRHRMRHLRCPLSIHSAFPGLPHTIKSAPPFLNTKQNLGRCLQASNIREATLVICFVGSSTRVKTKYTDHLPFVSSYSLRTITGTQKLLLMCWWRGWCEANARRKRDGGRRKLTFWN